MTRDFPPVTEYESDDELASDLTVAIAEAVADAKGVSPFALDQPLYDAVDPEVLADLVRSFRSNSRTDATVEFQLSDCRVDLHATGVVFVQHESAARPVVRSFDPGPGTTDGPVADGNDGNDDGDNSPRSDV